MYSWAFPLVSKAHYAMKFQNNVDWTSMKVDITDNSKASDNPTFVHFKHINVREQFDVEVGSDENSIDTLKSTYANINEYTAQASDFGDFWKSNYKNETEELWNQFSIQLGISDDVNSPRSAKITPISCIDPVNCYGLDENVDLEDRLRKWHVPADWTDEDGNPMFPDASDPTVPRVPEDGEDVEIWPGMNMQLETETNVHPIVVIRGRLFMKPPSSG